MCADAACVGVWLQDDTVTFNKLERQILKKLKKVNCFPGLLSEFKIFVAKLMKIDPSHPAIVPVYELIVGKTESYFPCKISLPKAKKRKANMRLSKYQKHLKSMLEGMGICLKIPPTADYAKDSCGLPPVAPLYILGNDNSDDYEPAVPLCILEDDTSQDLQPSAPLCVREDDSSDDPVLVVPACTLEDDTSQDLQPAAPLYIVGDCNTDINDPATPLFVLGECNTDINDPATPLLIVGDCNEDVFEAPLCKNHRTFAQTDKKWCDKERKRLLKAVKKRVGLDNLKFAKNSDATGSKRKTLKTGSKKRKQKMIIEVIDIAGNEDDSEVNITGLDSVAPLDCEVIDITGKYNVISYM